MNNIEMLREIFVLCVIPLLGVLTKYAIGYLQYATQQIIDSINNKKSEKYILMVSDTIAKCVTATNQTYVNSLKESNEFNFEAQKTAFNKTYETVIILLSEDAKKYIIEAYGDLNQYLTACIEAEVNRQKN